MKQKLLGLLAIAVSVIMGVSFFLPSLVSPSRPKANNNELVFLTKDDKQKLFTAIDATKTLADFDRDMITFYTEILDSYNDTKKPDDPFVISPEFLSDDPSEIIVVSGKNETNLLAGLEISSLHDSDLPMLKTFAKLFFEEYSRYPLAWLKYATPPVIVFAKSVGYQGEIVGGVEQGIIVYNITNVSNVPYTKQLIHHELMHWVEHFTQTYGDPWPEPNGSYREVYNLKSDYNYEQHPQNGFITGYAQTNRSEDKAEIYSFLFTPGGLRKLSEWGKTDPLLVKKVEAVKKLIRDRGTKMDNTYFETQILNSE